MRLRAVIIDDVESVRYSMRLHLEALGHEVVTLDSPAMLPCCLAETCPSSGPCHDVLFVDYNMPKMDGLEFLEGQVQRQCKQPDWTRFLFSGYSEAIDAARLAATGSELLVKPLRLSEINQVLTRVREKLDPQRQLQPLPDSLYAADL